MKIKKMETLGFKMPPFARIQWASSEIKNTWGRKLHYAQMFVHEMEVLTVQEGLRHVTTAHVEPDELLDAQMEYAKKGLYFLPLQKVKSYTGMSTYHPLPEEGEDYNYYGVLADSVQHAEEFAHYTELDDHKGLGKLLGYPSCCSDFFHEEWLTNKFFDPAWQLLEKTDETFIKNVKDNFARLNDTLAWETNNFLRNINIGPNFHVPCSYSCEHTLKYAQSWFEIAEKHNVRGTQEVEEFLRMPMEWDCHKGIAYIRTPVFKLSVNSSTSTERFIIQREGTFYPDDAPKGLAFPWNEYTKSNKKSK